MPAGVQGMLSEGGVGAGVPEPGRSQITGRIWKPVLLYVHWDFKQESKLIYILKDHSVSTQYKKYVFIHLSFSLDYKFLSKR